MDPLERKMRRLERMMRTARAKLCALSTRRKACGGMCGVRACSDDGEARCRWGVRMLTSRWGLV